MYRKGWMRAFGAGAALFFQQPAAGADAPAGPRPVVERPFVVVLDPGHGGTNAGCSSFLGDAREKEITLRLALEVRDALRKRLPQAQVVLTREGDRTMTLAERVAAANAAHADVFISLHTNASRSRTQQGFETYILDVDSSTLDSARTARRENDEALATAVSSSATPPVGVMVRQLAMSTDRSAAARLAHRLQAQQRERFPERIDRGVKQAPFDVLMGARMPAVLFEAGFLDHPAEAPLLTDEQARAPIVEGVVEAIVEHYRERSR